MKKLRKRGFLIETSILILSLSSLTSCANLGYVSLESYYETFGDSATLIYTDAEGLLNYSADCSIKDSLYNAQTVNELKSDNLLDYQYYEYLALKVEVDDFEFCSLALYVKAETEKSCPFVIQIAVVDNLPVLIKNLNSPDFTVDDQSGETTPIIYDDSSINWNVTTYENIKSNAWIDICIEDWKIDGAYSEFLPASKDSYILFQFKNNTGYGKNDGLLPVKFSMLNLMVAAYDPDGESELYGEDDDDIDDEDYDDPDDYDDSDD